MVARLLAGLRRLLRVMAIVVTLAGVLVVFLVAILVGPYVRDDLVLDRIVQAVALDWRDGGEDRARTRLQFELDHRGVGMQVSDSDCVLEAHEDSRSVTCVWTAEVVLPFTGWALPIHFSSEAVVDPSGDLR